MVEVPISGGVPGASSNHAPPWDAYAAFTPNHPNAWHNGGANYPFPNYVWYKFPAWNIFKPARVSFRARNDCCQDEGPTQWQFVGSNDANCHKDGT